MPTYYCNVWFLCNDNALSDFGLLQKALSLVKSRQGNITTSPGRSGGGRHCLAIPFGVTYSISAPIAGSMEQNLFIMAEGKLDQWILGHRRTGNLPFCRYHLFQATD